MAASSNDETSLRAERTVRIRGACPYRWPDLEGAGERTRFCSQCGTHVENLSALTESEAIDLLRRRPDACVRFVPDRAGRPRFRPDWRRQSGRARVRALVLVVLVALAGSVLYAARPRPEFMGVLW